MKRAFIGLVGFGWLIGAGLATAGYYDGKKSVLCTTTSVTECNAAGQCQLVPPEEYGDASQFVFDFKSKTLDTVADTPAVSKIERQEVIDGQLYVQGIEDGSEEQQKGAAWSVAIGDPTGVMTATIARSDGTAFVIRGACAPNE